MRLLEEGEFLRNKADNQRSVVQLRSCGRSRKVPPSCFALERELVSCVKLIWQFSLKVEVITNYKRCTEKAALYKFDTT